MINYEYQNDRGQKRCVVANLADRPPEVIRFLPDGKWEPAEPESSGAFTRVYSTGAGYVNRFSAWRSPLSGRGLEGNLDKNSGV